MGAAAETTASLDVALGHALQLLRRDARLAEAQVREILKVAPDHPRALRLLGAALARQGDAAGSGEAYLHSVKASSRDPELVKAALAMGENRLASAEQILRERLKAEPDDVAAIRMLGEVGMRLGRQMEAETLFARCLELAPGFSAARHNLATCLYRQNRNVEALKEVEILLKEDPRSAAYRNLRGAVLGRIGEYEESVATYRSVIADHPDNAMTWLSIGHGLKTLGRKAEAIDAYRRCVEITPHFGEAWWSLANMKTVPFPPQDVARMRIALTRPDLNGEDRFHLHYALGKAYEDAGDWTAAFRHYAEGAALRRQALDYDPEEMRRHVRRCKALFTPQFLAERAGQGCPAPDPIFIIGLPRSGSTLLEQILSSHSQVEGTHELPDIVAMSRRLGGRVNKLSEGRFPEAVADLSADELRALGEEYLERTRVHRKTDRPRFIDKMPNNWVYAFLICLILPNAKIVDARRHPMGAGFSNFKQHFARGQAFSYDLAHIGRFYADYVELMAYMDAVLPGRVHRVIYERMVADPEAETRALLDYCGLPFEAGCLRFYENDRAVRTPSSEQVRRPIFTDAAEHWRNFEPWLGPLKAALGPVLDAYPEAPAY